MINEICAFAFKWTLQNKFDIFPFFVFNLKKKFCKIFESASSCRWLITNNQLARRLLRTHKKMFNLLVTWLKKKKTLSDFRLQIKMAEPPTNWIYFIDFLLLFVRKHLKLNAALLRSYLSMISRLIVKLKINIVVNV